MSLLNYKEFLNESFLYESDMQPSEWKKGKYVKAMIEFLGDKNKELKIDPKFSNRYKFSSFNVKDIENIDELKQELERGVTINSNSPLMKVKNIFIPLTHLQKTGIFTVLSATATDTDTKEGMVIYFYYNQGLKFWDNLDASLAAVNNINGKSLHRNTLEKLKIWISNADESIKEQRERVNEWQSAGDALSAFARGGMQADRYELLNDIRNKARQLTGLSPDNWCPGDIYLYDPSALSDIQKTISNASSIGELNLMFNDVFGPRSSNNKAAGSIWAISLKQAEARLGRAKEFVKGISQKDTVFNLTKEEIEKCKNDPNWGREEIKLYQDKIAKFASSADITVKYTSQDPAGLKDTQVQSKLAAIKLAYHLLSLPKDNPNDIDSNLLAVLKFGLKQADPAVNPPYFKVTGQPKGSAKVESLQGGDTLTLLAKGLDNKESKLAIEDKNTRMDVRLFYYVAIGDIAYEIELTAKTSGNNQAGLEFQGKTPIGDAVQDPSGVESKLNSLFSKR